jgi:hypothetical protein
MLNRPAVVVKVDNHEQAWPQTGLRAADVIVEEEVEGISRYAAVFWSQLPNQVGPVRSARTTDIDALGFLGAPDLAFSGANGRVLKALGNSGSFHMFTDGTPAGAWQRDHSRKAPHNLYVTPSLIAQAGSGTAPAGGFTFSAAAHGGKPANGVDVRFDGTTARWRWDAPSGTWRRVANGHDMLDRDGQPLMTPTTVVVAFVDYRPSSADQRSPEAITIGAGDAWLFLNGDVIGVKWSRSSAQDKWIFHDLNGNVVDLRPGQVVLELARVNAATAW